MPFALISGHLCHLSKGYDCHSMQRGHPLPLTLITGHLGHLSQGYHCLLMQRGYPGSDKGLSVQVFMPAAPFAALCLLASPWTPGPVDVFLSVATFLTAMSQQFHAWAHMKKSQLPLIVDQMQV